MKHFLNNLLMVAAAAVDYFVILGYFQVLLYLLITFIVLAL